MAVSRPNDDPVYYRICLDSGEVSICCLQSFDESKYDDRKWLTSRRFYDDPKLAIDGFVGREGAIEFLRQQVERSDLPIGLVVYIRRFLIGTGSAYTNILDT